MTSKPAIPPWLGIAFGILAVSTASIFIRFAQTEVPSLVIAAYRLSLATLILAPAAIGQKSAELRRLRRRDLWLALLSGIFLAIHFAAWISSLEYTSVASSAVLVTTTPLWVALLAPLTLGERLDRRSILGMLIALGGGIVVALSDSCTWNGVSVQCTTSGSQVFLGNALALAGAIMAAGYMLVGRDLRNRVSLLVYVFVVYGMAAITLLLLASIARLPFTGYTPTAYLWLILLALVPQILGHSSFNWALGYLPAGFVAITLLGEPVGATILAYLILGEGPTPTRLFGAILILVGILIASRR